MEGTLQDQSFPLQRAAISSNKTLAQVGISRLCLSKFPMIPSGYFPGITGIKISTSLYAQ
jgi:hypothetical protein